MRAACLVLLDVPQKVVTRNESFLLRFSDVIADRRLPDSCYCATESHDHRARLARDARCAAYVNEWSLASKMLTRAGQLVGERGFQQGSLVPVASVCIATALERAFLEGDYSVVDFNYAREALARVLGVSRDPSPLADDTLDVPYWGRNLMDWNDTPGRTAAEAIQAFDAAARKAMELREAALQRPKR